MTQTQIFPVLVLGTTEIYQTQTSNEGIVKSSHQMIGGNGLCSALAASKSVQTALISGIGKDIIAELPQLKTVPNLNLDYIIQYPDLNSFFYKSVLDQNGVEISGEPVFNCHRDFLNSQISKAPECQILHCSGTDPDFYLNNISNLKFRFLSVAVIDYFLSKKLASVIKLMNLADIIFLNQAEYAILQDQIDFADKILIVTSGENGLNIYQNEQVFHFEAEIISTTNTVNAGDVLAGSMLASFSLVSDLTNISQSQYLKMVYLAKTEVKKLLQQHSFYRIKL